MGAPRQPLWIAFFRLQHPASFGCSYVERPGSRVSPSPNGRMPQLQLLQACRLASLYGFKHDLRVTRWTGSQFPKSKSLNSATWTRALASSSFSSLGSGGRPGACIKGEFWRSHYGAIRVRASECFTITLRGSSNLCHPGLLR